MAVDNHAMLYGGIAQLGERLNGIQEVRGSTPLISTSTESGLLSVDKSSDFCLYRIRRPYFPEDLPRKPQIPPRPKQENRAHVHEPGQNIRIDQSEV